MFTRNALKRTRIIIARITLTSRKKSTGFTVNQERKAKLGMTGLRWTFNGKTKMGNSVQKVSDDNDFACFCFNAIGSN